MEREELERITKTTLDCCYKIHTALGPGMLESAYEACLMYELKQNRLSAKSQVELPILYDGVKISAGYRLDVLVENELIVELKAVDKLHPVHTAQILSYLKLSNKKLGLLINFNVPRLKQGVNRIVNDL